MSNHNPFAHLPRPQMIEQIDIEAIVTAHMADLKERLHAAGIPYNVETTGYDPARIQTETNGYRETLLRTRINDATAANLLAFAGGIDLDYVAGFYDVERLAGETDDALRLRTNLAIKARSPGGSAFWYAAAARRADVRIRDIAVYREPFWPIIHIAVLSSVPGGIPDQAMLDAVTAEVMSDRVRLINDTLVVEPAVTQVIDIEADIVLLPSAPQAVFEGLSAALAAAWHTETGIGFDLERSWIEARLHVDGIKRVDLRQPAASAVAPAGTAISLGEIRLTFSGRDY
ncbi:baseplate J protein [Ensifer adhaerens]|nr:baseplate J protein [Ensifer adhaerens]